MQRLERIIALLAIWATFCLQSSVFGCTFFYGVVLINFDQPEASKLAFTKANSSTFHNIKLTQTQKIYALTNDAVWQFRAKLNPKMLVPRNYDRKGVDLKSVTGWTLSSVGVIALGIMLADSRSQRRQRCCDSRSKCRVLR